MAMLMGMVGSIGSKTTSSPSIGGQQRAGRPSGANMVVCAAAGSLSEQYKTLKVQPGSTEKEVKKAFRKLALQYHPDVCKEKNCSVQFHRINDAYDMILNSLRLPEGKEQWRWGKGDEVEGDEYDEETMSGMDEPDWELWEEWMGWEGAGIRDYSSHINPYI